MLLGSDDVCKEQCLNFHIMVAVVASMLEVLELASVLVPCRAAPLSVPARPFATRTQWDVVYICVVVVWSIRVLLVGDRCPLLAARTQAGSSCTVRIVVPTPSFHVW